MSINFPQPGRQTIKQSAAESIHLRVGRNFWVRGPPRLWKIPWRPEDLMQINERDKDGLNRIQGGA
jgi:hypothetical protein